MNLVYSAESVIGNRKNGTYISAVCRGRKKQAGGFYWKYMINN